MQSLEKRINVIHKNLLQDFIWEKWRNNKKLMEKGAVIKVNTSSFDILELNISNVMSARQSQFAVSSFWHMYESFWEVLGVLLFFPLIYNLIVANKLICKILIQLQLRKHWNISLKRIFLFETQENQFMLDMYPGPSQTSKMESFCKVLITTYNR